MNTKLMYALGGIVCLIGIFVGGLKNMPVGLGIGWTGVFIICSAYWFSSNPADSGQMAPRELAGAGLICPRCQGARITVQVVTESQLERVRHGAIWWALIGWYWVPVKWLFFTLPALIVKIFAPKKQKIVSTHRSMFVCQSCGNMWEASTS